MNEAHLRLCASAEWGQLVADHLLPWAVGDRSLGHHVLEVGPGPGLTTDLLVDLAPRVTALELDRALATELSVRLGGRGVGVVLGDAASMPLASDAFSAVTAFTMLHHVPGVGAQDRLLGEAHRVLMPGGVLVGTDGLDTPERRGLHVDDVFVPLVPARLPARLEAAGFIEWSVETDGDRMRFSAVKPA